MLHQHRASRTATATRPILHRASIAEMVVPYADPSPVRSWQNYFDTGEYLLGQQRQLPASWAATASARSPISTPCIADDLRQPRRRMPQRDLHARGGLGHLWKHTDTVDRHQLDPPLAPPGDLLLHHHRQLRLRLLLVPLPRRHHRLRGQGHRRRLHLAAYPGAGYPYATEIAPGLWRAVPPAPVQRAAGHGDRRRRPTPVEEVDVVRLPMGPRQPRGNAFTAEAHPRSPTRVRAARAWPTPRSAGRWHVSNPRLAQPARRAGGATRCMPERGPTLLAGPGLVDRPARDVRLQAPVGDPVRPERSATPPATSSTSTPAAPACRPTWAPDRRPLDGHGHRALAHLRPDALPAARGLADHAGRLHAASP